MYDLTRYHYRLDRLIWVDVVCNAKIPDQWVLTITIPDKSDIVTEVCVLLSGEIGQNYFNDLENSGTFLGRDTPTNQMWDVFLKRVTIKL